MVGNSMSGSGAGSGRVTAPGYPTLGDAGGAGEGAPEGVARMGEKDSRRAFSYTL
jgi:hypothetical protein